MQASAGHVGTVLLRSDGHVVACGGNNHGQCNIPVLPEAITYIQASAGGFHTVLLKSDGHVGSLWKQFSWSVRYSGSARKSDVHSGFCGTVSHRLAEERWLCGGLWMQ
eukprot:TRINITY_DN8020_c0_g1_i1.p2 TRINITY_DN8020_c0_g1~~TRINITY_DN8020_c0_g1_i1.p2  ORF type:complete len:108 (+),score=12.49 TRINITY_DN8020_c0_g1_i1:309-632(+)